MADLTDEALGRLVRDIWVAYCRETGDEKPAHLAPYDSLSEWDQEADRRIGRAVAVAVRAEQAKEVTVLRDALAGLLKVIATDRLIPESVWYMRGARAALAAAPPEGRQPTGGV